VNPGHTTVIFTPVPRSSSRTDCVKLLTNDFVAPYVAFPGVG